VEDQTLNTPPPSTKESPSGAPSATRESGSELVIASKATNGSLIGVTTRL